MDFETQRKKRMQDLEEKRRRLDEMRKLRKDRTDAAEDVPAVENSQKAVSVAASSTTTASSADERAQVDDLVSSLLVSSLHESIPSTNTTTSSSSGVNSSNIPPPPVDRKQAARAKALTLTLSKCSSGVQILPTVRETYDKSSQTDSLPGHDNEGDGRDNNVHLNQLETPLKRTGSNGSEQGQAGGSTTLSLSSPHHRDATPSSSHQPLSSPHSPMAAMMMRRKVLSEEDQKELLNNDGFRSFMHTSLLRMERSLAQVNSGYDIMKDYTRGDNEGGSLSRESEGKLLSYRSVFDILRSGSDVGDSHSHNHSSLKGRPVMDIHCSPHYPELILAAYGPKNPTHKLQDNNNNSNSNSSSNHSLDDAPGLVAVWSLGLPTRPEYLFTSLSPVVTARFHSEEPHLILGGCYSGQILLWDMRAKSFLPIQRSSLATGKGHKHPICGMTMVRSGPTLELITASSDG